MRLAREGRVRTCAGWVLSVAGVSLLAAAPAAADPLRSPDPTSGAEAVAPHTDKGPDPRAAAFIQGGDAAGYHGQFNEAVADFSQALSIEPDSTAFLGRGVAYLQLGRFDPAIADFSQAIVQKPDFFEAYQSRGVAYDQKGLYDRAIDDYTHAIALRPDVAQVFFNRGAAYEHRRLYRKAALDYRASLTLDPSLQSAKEGLKRMGAHP